jgi:ribonuclease HIII
MNAKSPAGPFVAQVSRNVVEKLREDLKNQGFELSSPPYTFFLAKKKGISITLYQSLKLTVQGKEIADFIQFYLEPEILQTFHFAHPVASRSLDLTGRIGVDEAGKGDFFGPLCIAAVYAEGIDVERLAAIGVKDSKLIKDSNIVLLGQQIRKEFQCEVIRVSPARYNEIYPKFGNLNSLLAWGHATAIEKLVTRTKCPNVIIDKFAHEQVVIKAAKKKNLSINLTQKVRAEEDLVVAAASIMARYAFLDGMEKLGAEYGFEIPKGASRKVVEAGKKLISLFGSDVLPKVAKMHFRTALEIL